MAAIGHDAPLNRRLLTQLDKLLRDRSGRVKINDSLRKLHQRFEFGDTAIEAGYLRYTSSQLEQLERECRALGGYQDSREVASLTGDRHQMAALTHHEKLAIENPSRHKIYYRPSRHHLKHWGLTEAFPQCSLRVSWQSLPPIDTVLIVENLDSFDAIDSYRLPPECGDLPVIYRGHGVDAQAVKALIRARPQLQIIWFGDWDPKGLLLALEFNACGIVMPADFSTLKSDKQKWQQQATQRNQLDAINHELMSHLWQDLKSRQGCWMQQQAQAHQTQLVLHPLS